MTITTGVSRPHRALLLTATAMTALLVVMGGIVCVTESGAGCRDWPRCFGQMVPPMRSDAIIEYTHRLFAALTSPIIIAAALMGWMKARSNSWVSRPPLLAVVLLIAVVVFGAIAVLRGLPPWAAALDVGSALLVLALMLMSTIVAFSRGHPLLADRLSFSSAFVRLALVAAAGVFAVFVGGVLVADDGSAVRCLGCLGVRPGPEIGGFGRWIQLGRDAISGVAAVSIAVLLIAAWRTEWRDAPVRRTAIAAAALGFAQIAIGALVLMGGATIPLLVASVITAVALWISLVALVVLGGLVSHPP